MNVIDRVIERIEARRADNKAPCKSYASQARAEQAARIAADRYGRYFARDRALYAPARYIVAYNEAWGRWVVAFDFTELLRRPTSTGGYLGIAVVDGFFTY